MVTELLWAVGVSVGVSGLVWALLSLFSTSAP
jgi:hypothetical protein